MTQQFQSWVYIGEKNDGYVHNHDLHPFVSFSILVKLLCKYQRNINHQERFISSNQESKSLNPKERKLKNKTKQNLQAIRENN